MAASSLDGHYLKLARSMEIGAIPERLRCATCDKLAINAVKLPCCDNTICGDCHNQLSATECPLCMHSPFAADMCVPAKALQTTVKVFIKNEAKKRGIDLKTGAKIAIETPTPVAPEPADTTTRSQATAENSAQVEATSTQNAGDVRADGEAVFATDNAVALPTEEHKDEARQANGQVGDKAEEAEQDEDDDDDDNVVITTERPELEHQQQKKTEEEHNQYNTNNTREEDAMNQNMHMDPSQQGFGLDQGMGGFGSGNFGNMAMNMNGFNPMMGMPGFGMGMPNMMSMPGMVMDPSMMFHSSFGGMGDMSMMDIGMGNMGGGMSGMGDFNGMGGPGFFPNQGSYMQSNYGNPHRPNFFNDRGYGRGFGRGFGRGARGNQFGRGRGGGWGYQQQQYGQNQQQQQQQQNAIGLQQSGVNGVDVAPRRRGSPSYKLGQGPQSASTEHVGEKADKADETDNSGHPEGALDTNHTGENANDAVESVYQGKDVQDATLSQDGSMRDEANQSSKEANLEGHGPHTVIDGNSQIEALGMHGMQNGGAYSDLNEGIQQQQFGYGSNNLNARGSVRNSRGGFLRGQDSTELTPAPAPPVNAPTGPKAMRQGLPNTGWAGRALTHQPKPAETAASEAKAPSQPRESSARDDRKLDDRGKGRGRSGSRSRSRRRGSKDDRRNDGNESDEAYARRKERDRRKRKGREERHEDERATSKEGELRSNKKYRSRSESRTDDGSHRRHRDKDDEYRSSRSHRDRSKDRHRRRHHSKSPAREEQDDHSRRKSKSHHDRGGDYECKESRRSRKHSTREEYEHSRDERKERSHRSSKHERKEECREAARERPRAVIEPPSDELGFKIKGTKSGKVNNATSMAPPPPLTGEGGGGGGTAISTSTSTLSDPYAEERARAQQTREAREAQRRMTSTSALGKRGRGGDKEEMEAPRGPKGDCGRVSKKGRKERRVNYKYEDEVGAVEDDDRDSSRWR